MQEELNLPGALGLDLPGLVLEDVDELATNELALLLGVVDALKTSQKLLAGINNGKIDTELLLQNLLDQLALVQAHTAIVDQYSFEAITDSLGHQLSGDSGINAPTDGTKNLTFGSDKVTNTLDLLADEFGHGPVLLGTTDTNGEVLQKLTTLRGVWCLLV